MILRSGVLVSLVIVCSSLSPAWGQDLEYARDIKPLLTARCGACHGALKQNAGLRLDVIQGIRQGGDSGPIAIPSDSGKSLIVQRITAALESRMPPEGEGEALKPEQVAVIKQWIDAGMPGPDDEPLPPDPRKHWAFVPPVKAPLPQVQNVAWQGNPVDAFLAKAQEELGLVPQSKAAPGVLLRRVYLDLIGLPPTREVLHQFLADPSPAAYEKVVDQLLESPQYGERWGRHWMDVWRYSDWDGFGAEIRESQPHIWRWRDWIIESLNADKPYDQMIREMIAADELYPNDQQSLRATGFLGRNWYKFNRNIWLENTIEHTSKAFLGVTFNCARCHDHKYDPIAQTDYYRLRAFFEPYDVRVDPIPSSIDPAADGLARVFDRDLAAPTYVFERGNDKKPKKDELIQPGLPEFLGSSAPAVEPVSLNTGAYYPASNAYAQELAVKQAMNVAKQAQGNLQKAQGELSAAQKAYEERIAASAPPTPSIMPAEGRLIDDNFSQPLPEVWTIGNGEWSYASGKLIQSRIGDQECLLKAQATPPRNFVASLRFKVTGGLQWKSVGIAFDRQDSGDCSSVYMSAHQQGPKVQVSLRVGESAIYPEGGMVPLPPNDDKERELTIALREQLLNVHVDGKLVLAYSFPEPRAEGALHLYTYDAAAEFVSFRLAPLAEGAEMVASVPKVGSAEDPAAAKDPALVTAKQAVQLSEQKLQSAAASVAAVKARIQADQARFAVPQDPDAEIFATIAATAEKQSNRLAALALVVEAEGKLNLAKLAMQETDEPSKKAVADAEAALQDARTKLAATEEAARSASGGYTPLGPVYPATSSGRRTALARWISSPQNPLAARVAVNHIWLRHFGEPLVASMFDFGRNGKHPTHPELLDWLAVQFMEQGWTMKSLHKMLVTSQAYQLKATSAGAEGNLAKDSKNTYLWMARARRAESEVVRDCVLSVAGQLDLTPGGPDLDPSSGLTVPRRSIYFRHTKEKKVTFLAMFDSPGPTECYRRNQSIAPQQALALANSELTLAQSRKLAARLSLPSGANAELVPEVDFIVAAFETILTRGPTDQEQAACQEFLAAQARQLQNKDSLAKVSAVADSAVPPSADPRQRARENLVHVLMNHNDFVIIH